MPLIEADRIETGAGAMSKYGVVVEVIGEFRTLRTFRVITAMNLKQARERAAQEVGAEYGRDVNVVKATKL